VEISMK